MKLPNRWVSSVSPRHPTPSSTPAFNALVCIGTDYSALQPSLPPVEVGILLSEVNITLGVGRTSTHVSKEATMTHWLRFVRRMAIPQQVRVG